ncbi:MAG: hypothetical protein AB7G12_14175 [Thermoanaerobaculia bacterium]
MQKSTGSAVLALAFGLGSFGSVPERAVAQPGTGLLRVATTGSDSGSCGSVAQPCRNPQRAVNLAVSGDEIRIAAGSYTYQAALDTLCTVNIGTTAVICILNKELTIGGGYATTDWANASPDSNPTVIDGLDSRRGVYVARTSGGAPTASLVLTGLTVTRGRAVPPTLGSGDALLFAFGGGLQSLFARTEIRSVEFVDNQAIGANSAGSHGGAGSGGGVALLAAPAGTVIEDVRFAGNLAQGGTGAERGGYAIGGGLYTYMSQITAQRLIFDANEALAGSSTGDGTDGIGESADALGGGAGIEVGTVATMTGIRAFDNLARGGNAGSAVGSLAGDGFGGAIFAEGRSGAEATTLVISDLVASRNIAIGGNARSGGIGGGGGVSTGDVSLTLSRFSIFDNDATGGAGGAGSKGAAGGGGLYLARFFGSATMLLANGVVAANVVTEGPGATPAGGGGGALWLQGMDGDLDHLTIDANSVAPSYLFGSGLLLITGAGGNDVSLRHSTVSGHATAGPAAVHVLSGNTLRFDGPGLYAGNALDSNEGQGGSGTYVTSGNMASVSSIDYRSPGAPAFDYRIDGGSPAIDAAPLSSATIDFQAQTRDADPDIGADELGDPPVIFADGFESGRAWAWTTAVRP